MIKKVEFANMPNGISRFGFIIRYYFNIIRTWYLFNIKYSWVEYNGFVRIMKNTSFARMNIKLGHNVQFGDNCNVACDLVIGNYVLIAGRVCFIGKNDHEFRTSGQFIWYGERSGNDVIHVGDDVWIGHGCIIMGGVHINSGSIIAAGSVVNKSIPSCEIWGGIPAKKLGDRFASAEEKSNHLDFLKSKYS